MKITKDARKAKLLTEEFACQTWKAENITKNAIDPPFKRDMKTGNFVA